MNLEETIGPEQVEPFVQHKAELEKGIESLQTDIHTPKEARKVTAQPLASINYPKSSASASSVPEQTTH